MAINIDYSASPGAVLNAAYMTGKNKYQQAQQAAMLPFVRDRQQFQRQAYLYDLAWQHRQQLAAQQMVPVGPQDAPNGNPQHNVQINAQHRANDRARRQGHAIPFPDVEAGQPIPAGIVQEGQRQAGALRREHDRENAANQRNQANIDAANQRNQANIDAADRRAKGKADANAIPPAPDFSAPAAGELGPHGGHPVEIRGGKPVSMTDSSGYFGSMASADYSGYGSQPLASTGLVGSALTGYDGHYQTMANDLMQQWGQSGGNQQPPLEQSSPYLQFDENQYDQSAYYA